MGEAEIGVEHAHQRQLFEMMALGDQLRADDQVVLAALDLGEAVA